MNVFWNNMSCSTLPDNNKPILREIGEVEGVSLNA